MAGATATGKTALAIDLALAFDGEIISVDAFQVYRGLNVGTAKPGLDERRGIPHHLIDCRELHESFSVAQFQSEASSLIDAIHRRGKIPVLVGGTGLYLQALLEGYRFDEQSAAEAGRWRWRLRRLLRIKGEKWLRRLADRRLPQLMARYPTADIRRMMRGLEKYYLYGCEPVDRKHGLTVYNALVIGLRWPRDALYRRIDRRVDEMFANGLAEEVETIRKNNHEAGEWQSLRAIGYRQLWEIGDRQVAIAAIKRATRNLAKRQETWFRRMGYIKWYDVTTSDWRQMIFADVGDFLVRSVRPAGGV
ncbi:MAG: tRNA (adenosine(37)-N6)-dimethylallyltransferase MiaA [Negativicutes bacterium]|nr:tRNA (adenosine(37)-N6)-dimethylallyltransferase MiaA [Negativicutes bacterium]